MKKYLDTYLRRELVTYEKTILDFDSSYHLGLLDNRWSLNNLSLAR